MSEATVDLRGLNVLVLEDEAVIAMLLEDMLVDLGCKVVGPAAKVAEALQLVRSEQIGAALLDLNLGRGETGYPVADALAARAVPFAFVTGYGAEMPIEPATLRNMVNSAAASLFDSFGSEA